MIAEIISIGDELVSGQRLDTNSQWLSRQLGDLGVQTLFHTTVADALQPNVAVFRAAIERAEIVVSTGGLGPTADDLTRQALAQATGLELILDTAMLEHIGSLFARHNRPMPERNRLQAMFPRGGTPILNPLGTAPGIDLAAARSGGGACRVFALPGVPAEMFEMFAGHVAPAVVAMRPDRKMICHRRIKCFGAGESQIEQMLPDLIRRGRDPSVGITVSAATITLRVTAEGDSPQACAARIQPTVDIICQCLGNLVFGEEEDELEDVVVRRLAQRGQTLAVVEAGTEGLLAGALGRASRAGGAAENVFLGGLTLGSATATTILGHEPPELSDSEGFVRAMVEACRLRFGADYALAVGFFPRPDGPVAEPPAAIQSPPGAPAPPPASVAPPPEYHFALATAEKVTCRAGTLISHPSIWKPRAAKQAMNLLRLSLSEPPKENA